MKKILSLVLLLVLCVFLCSCQKDAIIICGNCASEVPKSSKYCPSCGVALFQNNANPSATNNTTEQQGASQNTTTNATEQPDIPQNSTNNTTTHTHAFSSATCTEPAKCSCGEVNGDALGHTWKDATCTSAKKCSRCGQTDGAALEHTWNEATCTLAKKCSQCGQTEGAALGHTATSVCTRCNTRLGWTKEEVQSLIKVYAVRVSDIDSADGVDMQIAWENTSSKSIKYVYFTVEAYNAVDDKVYCEIRDYNEFTGRATGPFESGYTTLLYDAGDDEYSIDMYWDNCYYNSTVRYFVLTNIHIIYMDNSEVNIDSDYTDYAFADIPRGLVYTWNEEYDGYEVNYRLKDQCSEKTITIPETYNGKNVVAISDKAFYGISTVQEIVLPDTIKYIGKQACYGCSSLQSITIPDGVTSIGDYTFYNCSRLTSVSIPDSVASIGSFAFYSCSSLVSITIPEGITSIGNWAFYNCVAIKEIHFNAIALDDFSESNYVFSSVGQSGSGITVTIGEKVKKIPAYLFCPERYFGNNTEPKIVRVDFLKGSACSSIGTEAFNGCRSLSYIVLPESITNIGDEAFARCGLTSITLPDGITNIGDSTFSFCDKLTSVVIPKGVTSIGNFVFYGCSALTSITIPSSVTQIGEYVFMSCPNLTSITFKGTVKQWNSIEKSFLWDYDVVATEVICSDGSVRIGW